MSRIINYDTNNIRVVRDDNNVNFYSKENLKVSGKDGIIILIDGTTTVEQLDWTKVTTPSYKIFDDYIVAVQGYIDEYVPSIKEFSTGINGVRATSFGELYTSIRSSQMNFKPTWGVSELRYTTTTSGTGASVIETAGEFRLSSGTEASGYTKILTNQKGQYQAGAMGEFGIGIRLDALPTGTQYAEWGYTDLSTSGFGFGVDVGGYYIFYISKGSKTKIYQNQWNGDKLNGTGESKLTLDLFEGIISQVTFTWYGYGDIDFYYYPFDPKTGDSRGVTCHHLKVLESLSIIDPNQPLSFIVNNGGVSGDNFNLYIGGHQFSILDGNTFPQQRDVTQLLTEYTTAGNIEWQPLIAVRPKAIHGDSGRANSVRISVVGFEVVADGNCEVRLTIGGTTSNLAWATPTGWTSDESATEVKVTGATALTTSSDGFPTQYGYVAAAKNSISSILKQEQITLGETQESILWIRRISAVGAIVVKHANITVTEEW